MSISPANSDNRLGQADQSLHCAKDEGLLSALASVPNFSFGDATSHPADRKSDNQAQLAATSPLQPLAHPQTGEARIGARDSDGRRSKTIVYNPPAKRQIPPLHHGDEIPPFGLSPASVTVMSNRGYVDLGTPRPMLRRRGHALGRVKKLMVASAIAATVTGCVAVAIWFVVEDSDLPGRSQQASRPPLPGALPPELRALMAEAEGIARAASGQPGVSLPSTAQTERQPTESAIGAPRQQMAAGSEHQRVAGVDNEAAMRESPRFAVPQLNPISMPELPPVLRLDPAPQPHAVATPEATPIERVEPTPKTATESTPIGRAETTPMTAAEPRSIATSESAWMARLGPPLESPRINHAPPHIGKMADRAGLLFADSNVRYLARADLQRLSADELHVARNEIFARRGRFFKDDALRAYFSQFPWYRPHAWEVSLSAVEKANVALIQSVEEDNFGFAQSSEAPVAASRGISGPVPARAALAAGIMETNAESGAPFADPSRRYLTPEELQGLSADQLAVIRNEIFARRGRYFKDDWLRAYFSQFPWYQPHAWDVPLSPIEQANVKLVQSLEQAAATPKQASRAGRGPM